MVDLFEDLQRLPPQFASLLPIAGRLVGVAQVDQHLGAVANSADQARADKFTQPPACRG